MPDVALLEGRYCSVEHLTVAEHYEDILDFYFTNQILSDWTYMYADPFESEEAVRQCLEDYEQSQNPYFFAIRDKASGKVLGTFSLMAITPKNRSVEMGRVILAPALQKTRAAVIRTGSRLLTVSGQYLRNDLRIGCLLRILMNRDNRNVL